MAQDWPNNSQLAKMPYRDLYSKHRLRLNGHWHYANLLEAKLTISAKAKKETKVERRELQGLLHTNSPQMEAMSRLCAFRAVIEKWSKECVANFRLCNKLEQRSDWSDPSAAALLGNQVVVQHFHVIFGHSHVTCCAAVLKLRMRITLLSFRHHVKVWEIWKDKVSAFLCVLKLVVPFRFSSNLVKLTLPWDICPKNVSWKGFLVKSFRCQSINTLFAISIPYRMQIFVKTLTGKTITLEVSYPDAFVTIEHTNFVCGDL